MGHWASLLGDEQSDELIAKKKEFARANFDITEFTCDDCPANRTCDWSFDSYNTDGDCLAEK